MGKHIKQSELPQDRDTFWYIRVFKKAAIVDCQDLYISRFLHSLFQVFSTDAVHISTMVSVFYLSCQNDHLCFCSADIRSADHCQVDSQLSQGTLLSLRPPCCLLFTPFIINHLKPEIRLSLTMSSETLYPSIKLGLILLSSPSEYVKRVIF